jgi:hypothetical protein
MFRMWFLRGVSQAFLARIGGRHVHRLVENTRRAALRQLRRAPAHGSGPRIDENPMIRDDGSDR